MPRRCMCDRRQLDIHVAACQECWAMLSCWHSCCCGQGRGLSTWRPRRQAGLPSPGTCSCAGTLVTERYEADPAPAISQTLPSCSPTKQGSGALTSAGRGAPRPSRRQQHFFSGRPVLDRGTKSGSHRQAGRCCWARCTGRWRPPDKGGQNTLPCKQRSGSLDITEWQTDGYSRSQILSLAASWCIVGCCHRKQSRCPRCVTVPGSLACITEPYRCGQRNLCPSQAYVWHRGPMAHGRHFVLSCRQGSLSPALQLVIRHHPTSHTRQR